MRKPSRCCASAAATWCRDICSPRPCARRPSPSGCSSRRRSRHLHWSPDRAILGGMQAATSHAPDPLIVAISSRALFDLEDSHALFEREGIAAYQAYQREREDQVLRSEEHTSELQSLMRI